MVLVQSYFYYFKRKKNDDLIHHHENEVKEEVIDLPSAINSTLTKRNFQFSSLVQKILTHEDADFKTDFPRPMSSGVIQSNAESTHLFLTFSIDVYQLDMDRIHHRMESNLKF